MLWALLQGPTQQAGGRENGDVVDDREHKHVPSLARAIAAAASGGYNAADARGGVPGGGARAAAAAAGGIEDDHGASKGGSTRGV